MLPSYSVGLNSRFIRKHSADFFNFAVFPHISSLIPRPITWGLDLPMLPDYTCSSLVWSRCIVLFPDMSLTNVLSLPCGQHYSMDILEHVTPLQSANVDLTDGLLSWKLRYLLHGFDQSQVSLVVDTTLKREATLPQVQLVTRQR
jgi:hypothetical protein